MLCKHCGKDNDSPVTLGDQPQEIKKSIPFWFKSLLGFVGLTVIALLLSLFLTKDLTDTVQEQLEAIRKGDIAEAYNEYSSKRFKEATSFDDFKKFIYRYPAFSENKLVTFKERNVNNDAGTLDCVMTTMHDKNLLVEYKLIKELDVWKVLSIRLEDMQNSSTKKDIAQNRNVNLESLHQKKAIKFSQFVLGSSLSTLGLVKTPSDTFTSDTGDIYLNLYLANAKAGTPIKLTFEHLDSHSSLNPVNTRVSDDGEAILSFVFSPPNESWPKGNYRIKASANEIRGSTEFKIN